nr:immunoglobulin heavy chain junction region [Macaca mulatta]
CARWNHGSFNIW